MMCELRSFSFILYKVGVTMERFVLQKYTFRFGLVIRFVLRIILAQHLKKDFPQRFLAFRLQKKSVFFRVLRG